MSSPSKSLGHLHCAQAHSVTRHWQAQGRATFAPQDFVLPLFVLNDDAASAELPAFPGDSVLLSF